MVIDLGKAGGENRAVTDLRLDDADRHRRAPTAWCRAVVRNFGPSQADGVLVRLTVDGRLGPEQSVDLPVGEDVPVVFNQQFATPGDHVVEVPIDDDPLTLDNRRWLVVPVRESLNVLLVDGHFKSEPFQAETDYLAQALAPIGRLAGTARHDPVEVVSESQLSRRDLAAFDVVVLCNVAQFSQAEVTALEDFLKQGGGVVVFGGDQVDRRELQPAALRRRQGAAAGRDRPGGGRRGEEGSRRSASTRWATGTRSSAEFRGESDPVTAGLTRALTWQFHKLMLPKDSTPRSRWRSTTATPRWSRRRGIGAR